MLTMSILFGKIMLYYLGRVHMYGQISKNMACVFGLSILSDVIYTTLSHAVASHTPPSPLFLLQHVKITTKTLCNNYNTYICMCVNYSISTLLVISTIQLTSYPQATPVV